MLGAGASTASGFKAGDWIDLAQTLFIALGGLWAFYLYLTSRRGQTAVGIQPTLRLAPGSISGETILLVGIRISNVSRALFRNEEAKATLMDASQRAPDGTVLLLPFAEQDPLLPVCGELTEDADEIAAGRTLYFPPTQTILLEPGESVDCDLAFPLSSERLKLLAMKIRISGFQARPIRRKLARKLGKTLEKRLGKEKRWIWDSFFFIDPGSIQSRPSTPAPAPRPAQGQSQVAPPGNLGSEHDP